MELNADFDRRVLVRSGQLDWVESPIPGVSRRMLDRIGDEVARATTIVRYAPGSKFSPHVHTGGEEFLVLEGVFQDEHGDFPAGSYIRNPPQSSHTPGSEPGCVIFVKLWQFDPQDRTQVRTNYNQIAAHADADRPGVHVIPLHADTRESVQVEQWMPGTRATLDASDGAELLVLQGDALDEDSQETLAQDDWLRLPLNSQQTLTAGDDGLKIWLKTGNMGFVARA